MPSRQRGPEHIGSDTGNSDSTDSCSGVDGTLAMLALLVRDRITARQFEILYRPFEQVIPLSELCRE